MKKLNIFRPGKHISAAGASLEFTEQDLAATVAAYDPNTHEAPIVVGHPKDNNPAYGWVSGLSFSEDTGLEADTTQVDDDFSEMVNAGRFKKISASFYTPESPNNPSPGVYYLRHVGFLGAQPPAVKGLRDASFKEAEEGIVEFSDFNDMQNASLWRKMREWIIGKYDVEEADSVIPSYIVEDMEQEARQPSPEPIEQSLNNFKEGEEMTPEEQAAMQAENERLKIETEAHEQKSANFAERESALAKQERAAIKANSDSFINGLVTVGKVLPAQKAGLSEFMQSLDETVAVEFGEGDAAASKPQTKLFKDFLESMPNLVEFNEISNKDDEDEDNSNLSAQEIADKAEDFMEEQAQKGREISISAAVAHVLK